MSEPTIRKRKLTDYKPDPRNANTGSVRGQYMLDHSVEQVGAARSLVASADDYIPIGNHAQQALADAGIIDVIEVETDGKTVVVVKRTDWESINDPDVRKAAILDNRTTEVGLTWNPEALLAEMSAGVDLSAMFAQDELDAILERLDPVEPWNPPHTFDDGDGILDEAGYSLSSIWHSISRINDVRPYMLDLPTPKDAHSKGTIGQKYSRTNATETERIVKTYMRPGDVFYEMCCGWMTFSSTAKYYGFSGKGSDIWDVSLDFCQRQLDAMPGEGVVTVERADCRFTGEDHDHYDFVHSNPPFFSLEEYSGSEDDLAATGSYDRWLDAMADMGAEAARILKPGGLANFVINDFRENGILKPMHADFIAAILCHSGLVLHDFVVAEVISQALRFRKRDFERRRTVKCHEYVITFKKIDS